VYVEQPSGFVDLTHPYFIFKLEKSLYGLKQAPRAWYERLNSFLVENDFVKGKVDTTLFTKHVDNDILIVLIYVDDIIFESINEKLCKILNYAWRKRLNEYDGRAQLFSWTPNQVKEWEDFRQSSQVYKRAYQKKLG